jgi:hypothetical protein
MYALIRQFRFFINNNFLFMELEADFVDKVEGTPLNQTPLCNSTLKTSAVPSHAATKSVPVYKWGVSYDGRSDLVAFLKKVKDLTVARGVVTEDELFRSAYDFFTEPALTWYQVGSWNQLVTLLKTNFLPSDYDETIWETLRSRFQRSDEPTAIYVAAMTNIFNRLTVTPGPEEQLRLIKKKILPRYITALALQKVDSIEQLLSFCRCIDEADEAKNRNPVRTSKAPVSNSVESAPPRKPPSQSPKNSVNCWNCNKNDHLYSQCPNRRQNLFCYRCGRKDTTVKDCPQCSKKRGRVSNSLTEAQKPNETRAFANHNRLGNSRIGSNVKNFTSAPVIKPLADISKIRTSEHRDDNRPYVSVKINNESITALLDSAVNRSVLGREGLRKVNSLGLPVQAVPENLLVTTASDSRHLITGLIHLPISVKGRSETLPVLVMPSLNHTLILGVDFFKSFQVSLTIKNHTWLVDVSPPRTPDATTGLTPVNATVDALETPMKVPETMGLVELTPNQKRQTQEIEILYNRVNSNQRLGSTNQIEHVIDTGDAKPKDTPVPHVPLRTRQT